MNNDLISRQQAIDAFNTNVDELVVAGKENADSVEKYLNRVIDKIKELPSAQPKHGKWICTGEPDESWGMMYECSICGNHDYGGNYCSYCGAKMEDSEDERPDRQTTGD